MPTMTTFAPNTTAESAEVNENFQNINNVLKPTFEIAISGSLIVGTNIVPLLIVPQAMTIEKVFIKVKTAPTGANLIVDINKNGSTIWSNQANRITLSAGNQSTTQTTFNTTTLSEDDYISVDIDQVGSTVAGSDLTIAIRCIL